MKVKGADEGPYYYASWVDLKHTSKSPRRKRECVSEYVHIGIFTK